MYTVDLSFILILEVSYDRVSVKTECTYLPSFRGHMVYLMNNVMHRAYTILKILK